MSKSTTLTLDQIHKGYFIAWNITSQCWNTGKIEIFSGNKLIATAEKNGHDHNLTMLNQGSADGSADGLTVKVTVNEATVELKNSKSGNAIMDSSGKTIGYVYDICIEDDKDEDFNDFFINIVGWKKKG